MPGMRGCKPPRSGGALHSWQGRAGVILLALYLALLPVEVMGKQRMYQGVDIAKHVPTSVLPPGSMVDVIDVHYRWVGARLPSA